ncbi:uncharacterized protein LOC125832824 [Solanum verrucosum]|uniref:uncharacterized protein LOC125832824 n=1 Tax=Solanum verrucosum TaxID=315347 RepID=UPI0020D0F50C|nr:uncharacterized protein LOC125832824 [Solanum verrucosum]
MVLVLISSIVHVRKKNGQIRVCVDFGDLNNAYLKNEFPLPISELMIDATTGYEVMSFMDGSSSYTQIRMAPKDEKLTAFHTHKGWLEDITLQHVRRTENKKVDALDALASMLALSDQTQVTICQKWIVPPPNEDEYAKDELEHLVAISKNAAANGLVEAFNKTLFNLLKDVVSKSKQDWHEKMEEALWAYNTTYCTPTKATPYSLPFGVEVVLPLERQIPSLRLAIQEGLTEEENARCKQHHIHFLLLEALDEKRLDAQKINEFYQARLSRAFNKKVRLRCFHVGDQVLAVTRPIITSNKSGGKFTSKWDTPYVIQEAYSNGAYKLLDADGVRIGPINAKFLKRYYS